MATRRDRGRARDWRGRRGAIEAATIRGQLRLVSASAWIRRESTIPTRPTERTQTIPGGSHRPRGARPVTPPATGDRHYVAEEHEPVPPLPVPSLPAGDWGPAQRALLPPRSRPTHRSRPNCGSPIAPASSCWRRGLWSRSSAIVQHRSATAASARGYLLPATVFGPQSYSPTEDQPHYKSSHAIT